MVFKVHFDYEPYDYVVVEAKTSTEAIEKVAKGLREYEDWKETPIDELEDMLNASLVQDEDYKQMLESIFETIAQDHSVTLDILGDNIGNGLSESIELENAFKKLKFEHKIKLMEETINTMV